MSVPKELAFHGWTVERILTESRWQHLHRDLMVVELWCGVMSIVTAARSVGLPAEGFDINRIPGVTDDAMSEKSENIISLKGFLNAVKLVLRLAPQGLLWMAPVCSSWIFLNSSNTHRRKSNVEGDVNYRPVQEGNAMATVAALLMKLAWVRDLAAVMANPQSSLIFQFPDVRDVLTQCGAATVCTPRCFFDTRPLGERFYKLYKFAAVGPADVQSPGSWIMGTRRRCECPGRKHIPLSDRSPTGKVSGNLEALKSSAAYPISLGKCIVEVWLGAVDPSRKSSTSKTSQWGSASTALGWLQPDTDDEEDNQTTASKPMSQKSPTAVGTSASVGWLQPDSDEEDKDKEAEDKDDKDDTRKMSRKSKPDSSATACVAPGWLQPDQDDEEDNVDEWDILSEKTLPLAGAPEWLQPSDDEGDCNALEVHSEGHPSPKRARWD
jgi:hypothetical protein